MSQSEAAAAAASAEPETLKTSDGHGAGHLSAAFLTTEAGAQLAVLTAGGDGMVSNRQIRPSQNAKHQKVGKGVNAMDVNPARTLAVVSTENQVKLVNLADMQKNKILTKFSDTSRCCCWSKDGEHFVAAADDGCVKVFAAAGKVTKTVRLEPYVRGLAFDPDGQFIAVTVADGGVLLLDLHETAEGGGDGGGGSKIVEDHSGSSKEQKGVKRLKAVRAVKVDRDDAASRQGLAWLPDGGGLAVAGPDHDVMVLERLNWKPTAYLTGGHSGPVRVVAFSPNGLYAATGGDDCKVVVWRMSEVSVRRLPHPPSSISWHPGVNMLLCGTTGGGYAMWPSVVPNTLQPSSAAAAAEGVSGVSGGVPLLSPYKPLDEVDREADVAAEARAAAAEDEDMEDDDDDEDGVSGGGGGGVIKRRGLKRIGAAAAADSGAAGDDFDEVMDQLDAVLAEADGNGRVQGGTTTMMLNPGAGAAGGQGALYPRYLAPPKPKKPQAPVQPGSTPAPAAVARGEDEESEGGGALAARFLAYNELGCVVSKAGQGQHFIEVLFRDTSKHRLQPRLTDLYGFTAAALGPRGVAYISPADGQDRASMLMYRAFESWCNDKSWTVALPEGEDALVVAAGSSVVAVATSSQYLRLYSLAGRQLSILSLPGPPIALVAAGAADGGAAAAAACQHHLAVVCARGPPEPLHNTQQLDYTVYDVSRCSRVAGGGVVLSPGSKLTWLAFSREGLLAAMDSDGTLRVLSPEWGGSWVPVLDAAGAKEGCGSEHLWPVCLDSSSLTAVVTSKKAPHPQVLPPPVNTQVPLRVSPLAPSEVAPAAAAFEQQALSNRMVAAHLKSLKAAGADVDADVLAAAVEVCDTECDRLSLKLFNEYCKGDKQGRALELLDSMHTVKSMQGAAKLAVHHKFNVLAQHIQECIDNRLEWEAQQQIEAAAAAAQQVPHHWQQQEDAAAAAGGVAGGGGEDDMHAQLDQTSQAPPHAAGGAAGVGVGMGGRVPAMFGGAGGGSVGAGVKRKTAAGLGGKAGGGGGGNPFVRRKAK